MSPVGKIFLIISVYPLIYIIFLVIYIIIFRLLPLCKRCTSYCNISNRKITDCITQIKTNLATGFLIVAMLSYQNVTKAALQMVKCVDVYDTVLLIDSNVKCYEWWQYLIWLYIALCSIPFPIYLIFGPHSLKSGLISLREFLMGLVFPGPILIWLLLKIGGTKQRRKDKDNPIGFSEEMPEDNTDNNQADSAVINSVPETQESETEIDEISENTPLLNSGYQHLIADTSIKETLSQNLEGDYNMYINGWLNWTGVVLFLRMILVFLSVFIPATFQKISSMLIVSTFSLILYTSVRPCRKYALNMLLILSQVAIVFVGTCYLILATLQRNQYQSPKKDPITSGLQISIYVFSVLIPASCVLILALDFLIRILIAIGGCLKKCFC